MVKTTMQPLRRRLLLFPLLFTLLLGVPAWLTYRDIRQERLNKSLLEAVRHENAAEVASLLAQGVNPDVKQTERRPLTYSQTLLAFWQKLRRPKGNSTASEETAEFSPTGLYLALTPRMTSNFLAGWQYPSAQAIAIAKALLRKGADPNVRQDEYDTPLLVDAMECKDLELIQLMLEHGAKINACGDEGVSALYLAIRPYQPDIFRFLLSKGANVNAQDEDGQTPLMWASDAGNYEAVQLLLQHGANVRLKDGEQGKGRTALDYARQIWQADQQSAIVKLLKQAGARKEASRATRDQAAARRR